MSHVIRTRTDAEKEFVKIFSQMSNEHQSWKVWSDFCYMAAAAISNSVDKVSAPGREKQYLQTIKKYRKPYQENFSKLLAIVVEALERDPDQDFLGELFMALELGNHWKGQSFTPYSVTRMMAAMNVGDELQEKIKHDGYISVSDPACGAGATLMAFANECMRQKINYQQHVIFAAQDIDETAALMCYIQLSLLGCPGYVTIDDTLAHPQTGDPLFIQPADNVWLTPFYFSQVWQQRRAVKMLDRLLRTGQPEKPKKEFFFFTFQKGAENVRSY